MRKCNAVISAAILLLFIAHGVIGGFQMAGFYPGGVRVLRVLARALAGLIAVHMCIGIYLTAVTWRAQKKAGVFYAKENKLFLARRISGLAVAALMAYHVVIFFGSTSDGVYRLYLFAMPELFLHLLLVAALALHVVANVRPLLIGLGIRSLKDAAADLIIVLSVLLIFMGAMFLAYYFRWGRS